jgi:hypothetical protein
VFTKRHEQELAEIKALTQELDRRMQQILEQLGDIQRAQGRASAGDRAGSEAGKSSARPTGAKKGRARQAPTPVVATAGGAKPGKRRGPRKRRQAEPTGASEEE